MSFDRFAIEDVGQNPAKLARAIHEQLGRREGSVPVADIAYGLDIQSIEIKDLERCEGVLIMPRNKSKGAIGIKAGARSARQRFTIAHELGHFINQGHLPARSIGDDSFGFHCSKQDMKASEFSGAKRLTESQKKEVEANRFAAELLMPKYKLTPYLRPTPNLEHVVRIAQDLEVSREAAANHYVKMHDDPIAIVFSKNNEIRYIAKRDEFPKTFVWNKQPLPHSVKSASAGLSDIVEDDTDVWLSHPKTEFLEVQTFGQSSYYQMTMLILPTEDDEEHGGVNTSYGRH